VLELLDAGGGVAVVGESTKFQPPTNSWLFKACATHFQYFYTVHSAVYNIFLLHSSHNSIKNNSVYVVHKYDSKTIRHRRGQHNQVVIKQCTSIVYSAPL